MHQSCSPSDDISRTGRPGPRRERARVASGVGRVVVRVVRVLVVVVLPVVVRLRVRFVFQIKRIIIVVVRVRVRVRVVRFARFGGGGVPVGV